MHLPNILLSLFIFSKSFNLHKIFLECKYHFKKLKKINNFDQVQMHFKIKFHFSFIFYIQMN